MSVIVNAEYQVYNMENYLEKSLSNIEECMKKVKWIQHEIICKKDNGNLIFWWFMSKIQKENTIMGKSEKKGNNCLYKKIIIN